jgi:hypothetical protein
MVVSKLGTARFLFFLHSPAIKKMRPAITASFYYQREKERGEKKRGEREREGKKGERRERERDREE